MKYTTEDLKAMAMFSDNEHIVGLSVDLLALRDREKVLVDFANAVERTYRELSDSPNSFMISMQCLLTQRAALMTDADKVEEVKRRG
jgi:hypothetical protein